MIALPNSLSHCTKIAEKREFNGKCLFNSHFYMNVHISDLIFEKGHFTAQYFNETITINRLPFHTFVQEVNEIWYPVFLNSKFY